VQEQDVMQKRKTKAATTELSPISDDEDDFTSERCPLCKKKKCRTHLLACFDESGDDGEFGVGLVDGRLFYVKEIEEVLERIRLTWVQSVRVNGRPEPPQWIMKEQGLEDYYDVLGGPHFDLEKYESDEDAANDLSAYTDFDNIRARELLEDLLCSCGNWLTTRKEFDAPMLSTMYQSWWTFKPREVAKKFRAKLRRILLEANNEVKTTKRKSTTTAKKAKRIKPPTRTAKAAVPKKLSVKRASKHKSTRQRLRKRF
jgi:hypothetical protein